MSLAEEAALAIAQGNTAHEKRLANLAKSCAKFVRNELGGDAESFWPHGFVKLARSEHKMVSESCARWLVTYVKANDGRVSLGHNIGLARLALKRCSITLPKGLVGEIATLKRTKWDPQVRARDGASRRSKGEQYEALRRDLESVLSWLGQATYEDVQRASAEVVEHAAQFNVSASIAREAGLIALSSGRGPTSRSGSSTQLLGTGFWR